MSLGWWYNLYIYKRSSTSDNDKYVVHSAVKRNSCMVPDNTTGIINTKSTFNVFQ